MVCSREQIAHFVGGRVAGDQLRVRAQMTTGADMVETAVFKRRGLHVLLCF